MSDIMQNAADDRLVVSAAEKIKPVFAVYNRIFQGKRAVVIYRSFEIKIESYRPGPFYIRNG